MAGDIIDAAALNDFLQQTGNVGGKVAFPRCGDRSRTRPTYERCAFTVFPSLYEGWGLPIGESLWMGKPCLSSTRLPDGGPYVNYFDPHDEDDMHAALRRAIRGEIAHRRRRANSFEAGTRWQTSLVEGCQRRRGGRDAVEMRFLRLPVSRISPNVDQTIKTGRD